MIVDGQKYLNESEEDANSRFTIPIADLTQDVPVIADTLAMGTPHEVQYVLTPDPASIVDQSTLPQEGAKRVLIMAAVIYYCRWNPEPFYLMNAESRIIPANGVNQSDHSKLGQMLIWQDQTSLIQSAAIVDQVIIDGCGIY